MTQTERKLVESFIDERGGKSLERSAKKRVGRYIELMSLLVASK